MWKGFWFIVAPTLIGISSARSAFCDNGTTSLVADVPEKVLTSPNYPNAYRGELNCSWKITSETDRRVYLEANTVDLEEEDVLTVSEGDWELDLYMETDDNFTLYSTNNSLDVRFSSYFNATNATGFSITYRQVCSGKPTELVANDTRMAIIESPPFETSHPLGLTCSWNLTPKPQYDLYVRVIQADNFTEGDSLQVSNNDNLYKIGQTLNRNEFVIFSGFAVVELSTDSHEKSNLTFKIAYLAVCPVFQPINLNASTQSEFITVSSLDEQIPLNTSCSWVISVPSGHRLFIKVVELELNRGDSFDVYYDERLEASYNVSTARNTVIANHKGSYVQLELQAQQSQLGFRVRLEYFGHGQVSYKKDVALPQNLSADVKDFFPYQYDGLSEIEDGGYDMYDGGNKVYFIADGKSTLAAYNSSYFGDDFLFTTSAGYPFTSYYHISTKDNRNRQFAIRVESDYGADGTGTQKHFSGFVSDGARNLTYHGVQLFGACGDDPTICEVYFTLHLVLPTDRVAPKESFTMESRNKQTGSNTFEVTGSFQRSIIGYTLLSKYPSKEFQLSEIDAYMKRLLAVFGNDSYYNDFCRSSPCANSGTCADIGDDFACVCAPGFTSKTCSIQIRECEPNPCENNGQCSDLSDGFSCRCLPGYSGVNCSIDIDDCASSPCENNATCIDLLNDFHCACAPGFFNKNCSYESCHLETVALAAEVGEKNLTSLHYPMQYPGDLNCSWKISSEFGQRVYLEANRVDIGVDDKLSVQVGARKQDVYTKIDRNFSLYSTSNEMEIFFKSHSNVSGTNNGFSLSYRQVCPGQAVPLLANVANRSFLESPPFHVSRPQELVCSWIVTPLAQYDLYLRVTSLENITGGDSLLAMDNETTWDLITESNDSDIFFTGSFAKLEFRTGKSESKLKFKVMYLAVCPDQPVNLETSFVHQFISLPFFGDGQAFNVSCHWIFLNPAAEKLFVRVVELDLNPEDTLDVYYEENWQNQYNGSVPVNTVIVDYDSYAQVNLQTYPSWVGARFTLEYFSHGLLSHRKAIMFPANLTAGIDNYHAYTYDGYPVCDENHATFSNNTSEVYTNATYTEDRQPIPRNSSGISRNTAHKEQLTLSSMFDKASENSYQHQPNVSNMIADGGNDMFDIGNKVRFVVDGKSTLANYSSAYNKEDFSFMTYSGSPFVAYYHISTYDTSPHTYTIQVESDYGADGYGVWKTMEGHITDGTYNLSYAGAQIFGAGDATVCEVYFVVHLDLPVDGVEPRESFSVFGRGTDFGNNSFSVQGSFRRSVVGYTLLSKYPGTEYKLSEVESVLEMLLGVIGNDSYYESFCQNNTCKNGATCTDIAEDFSCVCAPGYTSKDCSVDINECATNLCENNGTCIDLVNDYECRCHPGYTSKNCSINIDECEMEPCVNGTCQDLVNDYWCNCTRGFTGKNCSINIDNCTSSSCLNNGTCIDLIDDYECVCMPGYAGDNCSIDIDECEEWEPCENNATCVDLVDAFECYCQDGYTGENCSIDINECLSNPCENGATCENEINGYKCICEPGYSAENCSLDVDDCRNKPCEHGNCTDGIADYMCNCTPGYTGKNCSINIDNCSPNPCFHNSTCDDLVNNYICYCEPGYTGKNCTIDINECDSSPCVNASNCTDHIYDFTCNCTAGYTGKTCAVDIDECESSPCVHFSTCHDRINDFFCECQRNYSGKSCETVPDICIGIACAEQALCFPFLQGSGYYCECMGNSRGKGVELCQPFCPAGKLSDKTGNVYSFPHSRVLETPGSNQRCPNGAALASALCKYSAQGSSQAILGDLRVLGCEKNVMSTQLDPNNITAVDAEKTVVELKVFTTGTNLSKAEVNHVTDVIVNLTLVPDNVELKAESLYNTMAVVQTVTRFLDVPNDKAAEKTKKEISSAVIDMAQRAALPVNQTAMKVQNGGISMQVVTTDVVQPTVNNSEGKLSATVSDTVEVTLDSASKKRYSFVYFNSSVLFPSTDNATVVISVQVTDIPVPRAKRSTTSSNAPSNITCTANVTDPSGHHPFNNGTLLVLVLQTRCGVWNSATNTWLRDAGCTFAQNVLPECRCNTFATFSFIVDSVILPSAFVMGIFTYVGCSLSVVGLSFTMLIYSLSRKLRHESRTVYICNISLCVMLFDIIFMAGSWKSNSAAVCYIVTVLLHYFLLASWCWMTANAITVFYQVMRMIPPPSGTAKASTIVSYVFPAISVLITVGVAVFQHDFLHYKPNDPFSKSAYRAQHVCWLHLYSLTFGFLVPVGVMLGINIILFIAILLKVTRSFDELKASTQGRKHVNTFLISVTLIFSTGLTWVFGYFMFVAKDSIYQSIMAWIFTILNSTQGVFIFCVYCIRRANVRAIWLSPILGVFKQTSESAPSEPVRISRVEALRKIFEP